MPYAKLTITIPDAVWISEVSRAHPNTRFRVLAATANEDSGVARVELRGNDPAAVCAEIRAYETVTDVTVLESTDGMTEMQVETTVPLLLNSLQDSGVPLEMPFEIIDGEMTLEATIPSETLSNLGHTLDDVGIEYDVDRIQQSVESESLLTDRQEWLVDEAIDRGYYDTPRRTTLVALADALDISKSTCSEILHRAEERVMKDYRSDDHPSSPKAAVTSN
ncbi:HTH-10 family transcription regulator (plasmid) [Halobacterium hubeiense]|uniref:HTH-10 family transcription regulator n=1 Tax=Halobacterium hubeiense TaxID=1407499 RepID=A0A0U5H7C6_9EURY|nr:helix-turn-helix domain-containing protein [Halobacterium hubeiense]CQH63863.1 HTH-10 family transcription regulator [Halobacterium hubeiense]